MAAPAVENKVGTNPFVGPRSFQTGERLYGRTRESTELMDLLIAERIVLLYSPSGAGKSSLINAALIPGMRKAGFYEAPVVRINIEPPKVVPEKGFNRYAYSMIRSLEETLPEGTPRLPADQLMGMNLGDYLAEYRKRAPADEAGNSAAGSFLLILDQFEEILRIDAADQDVKQNFFDQFGDMLRYDRSVWALIAIREDYLAAIESYTRPIPNRLSVTYRLDFLDAKSAIEAIQGPSSDSGVPFDDDAAASLVDSLRKIRVQKPDGSTEEQAGPYVEPVQLQVVCRRLWDKCAANKKVSAADVNSSGNIDDALSDYYSDHVKEAVTTSGVSERQIREWFDRKLITPIGIRGNVLMEPESSSGLPNTCIKLLQEAYLVRADKRGNAIWFELAHDRLTRPIRRNNSEWFSQHLSVFQRQADFWNLQGRPDSLILSGQAYLDAEEWVKENPKVLEEAGPEKDFLEACRQEHRVMMRERRLNTTIRWASLGLLVLTAASAFFFVKAQDAAEKANVANNSAQQAKATAIVAAQISDQAKVIAVANQNIADARSLVAQSVANLTVDPERSAKLALSAFDMLDPTKPENADVLRQAEDALRRGLPTTRIEQVLTDPSISPVSEGDHTFTSVSFDSAGTRMAAGSADGSLRVWSTDVVGKPAQIIQVFQPTEGQPGVTEAVFSPDGKWLAAAAGNGHVVLYDAATYALKDDETVQKSPVYALAFSRDGSRLAVGGAGGLAQIWSMQDISNRLLLSAGEADILAIAFSPDGTRAATGSRDGVVVVWDASGARALFPGIQAHEGAVSAVAFNADGRQLATSGSEDRFINLWNLADTVQKVFTISGHRDSVNDILFNQDGTRLISVSSDRTVRFWDTAFGRPGLVLFGHTDQVFGLALSPDGNHVATAGKDLSVRVWNIAPEGSREDLTFSINTPIHDLAISPDGTNMAAAGEDGKVYVTLTRSKTQVALLEGHTASVESAAFSPDGKRIITASQDGLAKIWNAEGGTDPLNLQGHSGPVWDAVFSPKGDQAATAGEDGTIILWDAQSGKLLYRFPAVAGPAYSVAFNKDGSLLAAGYANSQIILWDPSGKRQVAVLKGHTDAVRVVVFDPDGKVLASAGDDGSIRRWEMTSDPIGHPQAALRDNGDAIFALAFTHDGKHLFSGGADGIGTVWDMKLRQDDFHTYGQTDRISGVVISPDDAYLFTGGRDGTVRVHVFDRANLLELARKRGLREFTKEECLQFQDVACQVAATPTPTPVASGAPQTPLNEPSPSLYPAEASLTDLSSAGSNGLQNARFRDNYQLNRYERPFNSDLSVYYPDVDIQSAILSTTQKWLYFSVSLAGQTDGALTGNYAIELDMDGDGRGDYLITTLAPGADWSIKGVRIWKDKNRDVGGDERYTADPPQKGDGYETLVFDQGSGDGPDLAWSRIAPDSPNTVQIALLRSVVDTTSRVDNSFVWTAWASHDSFQASWFDYNDHFTAQDVGSTNSSDGITSLNNLPGLDNTCRYPYGVDSAKGDVFCRK